MNNSKLVVGIDSSTQSCKVEIRELETGKLIATSTESHPATFPPKSEQNPEIWWQSLKSAFAKAQKSHNFDKKNIVSIGVTAQCHGLVVLDKNSNVIRPAKLWNDTESSLQSDFLLNKYGKKYWIESTGSMIGPSFTITKLLWLYENEKENFLKIKKVILPHDYLVWKLSNRFVTDRAGASCTGYYSIKDGKWDLEVLQQVAKNFDWQLVLPEILSPNEKSGFISHDAAEELGLKKDVVIAAGTGDQMASALGLGIGQGDYVISLGTSICVFSVASNLVLDLNGLVNCVCDSNGKFLPIIVSLNGTKVTNLFSKIMNRSLEELSNLALDFNPAEPKLYFSALIDGERSPNLPNATGTLAGITSETTINGMARAAFDGVLTPVIKNYKYLQSLTRNPMKRLIVTGGGAKSYAYKQILADLAQQEITQLDVEESAARGACIQAASATGHITVDEILKLWALDVVDLIKPRYQAGLTEYFSAFDICSGWRGLDRKSKS